MMHLYHLTLQKPGSINCAALGNFSGTKSQELIVSRGGRLLELIRPDTSTGKLHSLASIELFCVIRVLSSFRLTGGNKDYVVVGGDSGRLVILEYIPDARKFIKVHEETFGKSGCRRMVPGQYVTIDPKGRAILVGAIEKQRFVYVMNRDANARLTISSPLEAHKSKTFIYDCIGMDVGFENPLFACLEMDYSELEDFDETTMENTNSMEEQLPPKMLTYYELDLGLNHVIRKWTDPVDQTAHRLIPVPGGSDGPGGVLICSERWISWKHQGMDEVKLMLPLCDKDYQDDDGEDTRLDEGNGSDGVSRTDNRPARLKKTTRGTLIVNHATHRTKNMFFFLQDEYGDLFKLTMTYEQDQVKELKLRYFDTVPVATGLFVLRAGFLMVCAEAGNHVFYQIQSLGDEESTDKEFSSTQCESIVGNFSLPRHPWLFRRHKHLKHMALVDEWETASPLIDCRLIDGNSQGIPIRGPSSSSGHAITAVTGGGTTLPSFCALTGKGPRSALRILRYGLEVTEMAVTDMPGNPIRVWTLKSHRQAMFDAFIVVTFINATVVLSIGETVDEVSDSGFLTNISSLLVAQVGEDSFLQVHADGFCHIHADKRITEWKPSAKRRIVAAAATHHQVALALDSAEIVYFEMDSSGRLVEQTARSTMSSDIRCLAMGMIPEGRYRYPFLAVGCLDSTLRILSLEPGRLLESLTMQILPALPESLNLMVLEQAVSSSSSTTTATTTATGTATATSAMAMMTRATWYVHVGLVNGVLVRHSIDSVTATLSDTRTRFLGPRAVRLFPIMVQESRAMLALASTSWLHYTLPSKSYQPILATPLLYDPLEYVANFSSEQCPEGLVAISGNTMRILSLEQLDQVFQHKVVPLNYTPRRLLVHPISGHLIALQSEHGIRAEHCPTEKSATMTAISPKNEESRDDHDHGQTIIESATEDDAMDMELDAAMNETSNKAAESGLYRRTDISTRFRSLVPGSCASCITIVSPAEVSF